MNEPLVVATPASDLKTVYAQDFGKEPAPKKFSCRDPFFAALFVCNVVGIVYLAATKGPRIFEEDDDGIEGGGGLQLKWANDAGVSNVIAALLGTTAVACLLCSGWLHWCLNDAAGMIRLSFRVWGGLYLLGAALSLLAGQVIIAVICGVCCVLVWCWWRAMQHRLAFAAANLEVGCAALKAHSGVSGVVFCAMLATVAWSVAWVVAVAGAAHGSSSEDVQRTWGFPMLISFYWGGMVCKNVAHVTVCGAVSSWFFAPPGGHDPNAVSGALGRALGSSFGSICLGSLLVAVLEAVRAVLNQMRSQSRGGIGAVCACCISCLLGYVERWIRFINKYAFVYVAAYGDDFRSAGRRVFELFEKRGFWATIINDIVLGRVLTMGVLGVGLTSAVAGLFIGAALLGGFSSAAPLVVACFGGLVGLVLASVAMGAVDSAVAAVYVCFGEDPQALRISHPEEFEALYQAWYQHYPQVVSYVIVV